MRIKCEAKDENTKIRITINIRIIRNIKHKHRK